jgi:hypothetical protein
MKTIGELPKEGGYFAVILIVDSAVDEVHLSTAIEPRAAGTGSQFKSSQNCISY